MAAKISLASGFLVLSSSSSSTVKPRNERYIVISTKWVAVNHETNVSWLSATCARKYHERHCTGDDGVVVFQQWQCLLTFG